MSDWQPFDWSKKDLGAGAVIDVLARYYDAGFNSFLTRRFCDCIVNEYRVIWGWPLLLSGDGEERDYYDLVSWGYRPIYWRQAPGPDDVPPDAVQPIPGPIDSPTPTDKGTKP